MADVEEIRGPQIGGQILLLDLEAHFGRILVAALEVVDRHRKARGLGLVRGHRGPQVGGEGGDAAFARQVIAKECDLPDFGGSVHKLRTWATFAETQPLSPGRPAGRVDEVVEGALQGQGFDGERVGGLAAAGVICAQSLNPGGELVSIARKSGPSLRRLLPSGWQGLSGGLAFCVVAFGALVVEPGKAHGLSGVSEERVALGSGCSQG